MEESCSSKLSVQNSSLDGSESWALKNSNKELLADFKRKMFSIIYGQELNQLYQNLSVVPKHRNRSLQCAGHMHRLEEKNVPSKKCFSTNLNIT